MYVTTIDFYDVILKTETINVDAQFIVLQSKITHFLISSSQLWELTI